MLNVLTFDPSCEQPREVLLANLPFTHSLDWRGLAYFLAAGGARIEHRWVNAGN